MKSDAVFLKEAASFPARSIGCPNPNPSLRREPWNTTLNLRSAAPDPRRRIRLDNPAFSFDPSPRSSPSIFGFLILFSLSSFNIPGEDTVGEQG